MKSITGNKISWKNVKYLFSERQIHSGKNILADDEVTDDDKEVANISNALMTTPSRNIPKTLKSKERSLLVIYLMVKILSS